MKSIVSTTSANSPKAYPYLGSSDLCGLIIVLFTRSGTGMVVHAADPSRIGEFSLSWCESNFTLTCLEVRLSNG